MCASYCQEDALRSCDTTRPKKSQKKYFIVHSRLVKQKNVQLLIETCTRYALPLKVIGEGYLRPSLEKAAGPTVEFLGFVPDRVLVKLYQSAIALLYAAQDEDFGIVPIEAQSAGVPVIAYKSGAVKETVIEGVTGYFFDRLTGVSVLAAIKKLEKRPLRPMDSRRHAKQFSKERFRKQIRTIVKEHIK